MHGDAAGWLLPLPSLAAAGLCVHAQQQVLQQRHRSAVSVHPQGTQKHTSQRNAKPLQGKMQVSPG
jgi:hypothetical protein